MKPTTKREIIHDRDTQPAHGGERNRHGPDARAALMVDPAAFLNPRITDRDSFEEFVAALDDLAPAIEHDIAQLRAYPHDAAALARLFRALHTVKGDAAMCKVDFAVSLAHPLESLLARCRGGEIPFTDRLADLMLLTLDRLELTIEALTEGRKLDTLNLPRLVGGLESLAQAPAGEIGQRAAALIEIVTDHRRGGEPAMAVRQAPLSASAAQAADLAFFALLAQRLDAVSPQFAGRNQRLLALALDTNAAAGSPVDPLQLTAAVHLHDIGMLFVPEAIWLKNGRLSESERALIHDHPALAAGLLERMPGWSSAAEMVLQHHEKPDGRGYPAGLKAEAICPGAKILAIVDAFEAVMLKHGQRGEKRSLIRAIAEINACDDQFAAEWIGPFNTVIRKIVES
ncbi:HD domain-containing phosphohydrolase [Sulfuricystis multivorans]|uniref:HD domain-containing phosphohydrolase n=1 Tax=Sulfuricystis multivorans TaxID=2211108 RepID=UPI0024E02D78|nr:HD domain-containing phosphohydrolase [Sulfuricystis multivorans]